MSKLLDFNQSFLKWKTKENSEAVFKIESTFKGNDGDIWYLSNSVLAGNVYADNNLPKVPMYHFLWAVSNSESIIYRYYSDNQNHSRISNNWFSKNEIVNTYIECKRILTFEDLINSFKRNAGLIAEVEVNGNIISFPIKHINILEDRKQFQIETGPILFDHKGNLKPCFTHFNEFKKISISYDYPHLSDLFDSYNAEILIYCYATN